MNSFLELSLIPMKLQGTGNPLVKSQSKLYLFYRKMSRKGGYLFDIPLKKPLSVTVHETVPFLCIPSQVPQASSFPGILTLLFLSL